MSEPVALIFPGQGSQSVGMGKALLDGFPEVRAVYDQADELLGYKLSTLCFEGPADQLNLTEYTQPAMLVSSLAALKVLNQASLDVRAVAGHSLGEYSAIVAAGGLTFAEAVELVQKRGHYMAQAVPAGSGLVAAVLGMSVADIERVCEEARSLGVVSPANFNCPGQVVIAGEKPAVERALELLKAQGCRRAMPLPVSVPVHTSLMQRAAARLSHDVEAAAFADLRVPLINNAEARPLQKAKEVSASLVKQLPSPVLWEQSMRAMWNMSIRIFIEVGPGKVLSGLIKRILPDAVTLNVQDPPSLDATVTQLSL